LTFDAGTDARYRATPTFRYRIATFRTVRLALADRHSRTRDHHCVHYRVVDLILNRPIGSPAAGHF
jgi:hypothetical protein